MSAVTFFHRLQAWFRRGRTEDDLSEELQFHLQNEIERNITTGMAPDEARHDALRSFGGIDQVKEQCRDVRRTRLLDELWQDVRYGLRMLRKNPGFTAVAVLSLALGIGANTAIFSVLNATLYRLRPYPKDPEKVFMMVLVDMKEGLGAPSTLANYLFWRDHNQVFEHLAAWKPESFILTSGEKPERITGAYVSANYFSSIGLQAVLGRTFLSEENEPGRERVCVLSYGLWQRRLGSDRSAIGRTVLLNGERFTVVGILPADFSGKIRDSQVTEVWTPMTFAGKALNQRVAMICRLKPTVTMDQARVNMNLLNLSLKEYLGRTDGVVDPSGEAPEIEYRRDGEIPRADRKGGWIVDFFPLNYRLGEYLENALFLLQGVVGFVLLIACANVANLLMARGAARQHEIGVRVALGATRFRLARQFFTEGLLLALAGGSVGLLLAVFGINFLATVIPNNTSGLFEYLQKGLALNPSVLGFTSISALFATVIFGLAPALRASNLDPRGALQEGGRNASEGFGLLRGRSLLVVFEIAAALVVLTSAGLMIKSFLGLKGPYADLDPTKVMITEITLDDQQYRDMAQINAYWEDLLQRTRQLPGVRSVGAIANLLGDMTWMTWVGITVEGHPTMRVPHRGSHCNPVTADYLQTMRIPLRKGRYFTERDMKSAPAVVVVNESFVRHFFADGEDPLGKEVRIIEIADPSLYADAPSGTNLRDVGYSIVGIVGDLKYKGAAEVEGNAAHEMYFPYSQSPEVFKRPMRRLNLAFRTDTAPGAAVSAIRKIVSNADKNLPMGNPVTLEQLDSQFLLPTRWLMLLMSNFAALAVGLASMGVYGVMAYFVIRRRHEIGIRMALGAQARDVCWLVLSQGLKIVLVGLLIGLVGALSLSRVLSSYIFKMSPTDPSTYIGVSLLLAVIALAACYIPARRTSKVDPMTALRCE